MESKNSSTKCIIIILSSIYSHNKLVDHKHPNKTLHNTDSDFNELNYMLNIFLPVIVGLFVALILGWMLIRYKMSSHQRSNYNGSIYCCPQKCFNFCAKFFECKNRCPKFLTIKNNQKLTINYNLTNKLIPSNELDKTNIVPKIKTEQVKRASLDQMFNTSITSNSLKHNLNNNSRSSSLSSQYNTQTSNQQNLPFRFSNRDSYSSRRESVVQIPDLIKSNNFSINLFHSFQSKNTSLFS